MKSKSILKKKWSEAFDSYKTLAQTQELLYKDPVRNQSFRFTSTWSDILETLGVFEYLLNGNVELFKKINFSASRTI